MQIVSYGGNLHEISNPILFWENNKNMKLSTAEFDHKVVKVKLDIHSSPKLKYEQTTF